MKRLLVPLLILVFGPIAPVVEADAINCDFANIPGANIRFDGSTDTLTFADTGFGFRINDSATPDLIGLYGTISGTFKVGAITGDPLISQTAPVTSLGGTLGIYDGTHWLTADLDWKDITVANKMVGFTNGLGAVNLSHVSYSGDDTELQALANDSDPTVVLSFLLSPSKKQSLTDLMADGKTTTASYSGSLSAVPEPSSVAMWGGMAIGLWLVSRIRRKSA